MDGIRTSLGIAVTMTKLIDFYFKVLLLFCLSSFSIGMNQNVNSQLNLLCPMGRLLELSSLWSGLQNLFWFQYKGHKVCLTKIPTHGIFKLLSVIYHQNICIVTCDF